MISINITVTSSVTGNVYSREINIGDADILRILAASNAKYFNDISRPGAQELMQKTNEIFDRVVDTFWGAIRTDTRDFEVEVAKEQAEATVSVIEEM